MEVREDVGSRTFLSPGKETVDPNRGNEDNFIYSGVYIKSRLSDSDDFKELIVTFLYLRILSLNQF